MELLDIRGPLARRVLEGLLEVRATGAQQEQQDTRARQEHRVTEEQQDLLVIRVPLDIKEQLERQERQDLLGQLLHVYGLEIM
ncbi:MAG: hypothetical protein IIU76_02010 [Bacteroidales bacterium]|nr:hypothetical protein [Bacteroidales bacterium]